MKQSYLKDEMTLSAYIDGELDAASMREIDLLLEKDEDARRYVLDAARTTALLRADMQDVLQEKVPQRLLANLDPQRSSGSRRRPLVSHLIRMAAVLVLGMLGFGIGILVERNVGQNFPGEIASIPARYNDVVDSALEYNLSGSPRKWRAPNAPVVITVTPVKTYRDKNGVYYREYHLEVATKTEQNRINGLACRSVNGKWKTKAIFF